MNYTIRCIRVSDRKYRTIVVVLTFDGAQEMWEHIDRCPHGHDMRG